MINPFTEVDWNPDRDKRRSFAISLIIGFPIVAVLLLLTGYVRGHGWNVPLALSVSGAGVIAGGLFWIVPAIARPFYVVWYFVACCIGVVVGNVLMAFVFYVFVAGLGLVMRGGGRRAVRKTVDRTAPTYWLDAVPQPAPPRYYRQF